MIPAFKEKEAITYNYLDASAIHCLHSCIRSRFDVQLWQDLHRIHPRMTQLKDLVEAWMVNHGIEFNDTNWCAVTKRYQRKRDIYNRREKAKNVKKKCQNNDTTLSSMSEKS